MIWQLLILGLAMGANNALASIGLGTSKMPRLHQLRTAITFAIFEAIMPIIGILVGEHLAGLVGNKAKWIGVAVLLLTGLYAILKKGDEPAAPTKSGTAVTTIFLAVALSLDNLTVGFGLGMLQVPLVLAACMFGAVSLVMTLVGLEVGRYLGSRVHVNADKLSGVVLLLVAGLMALT